MIRAIIQAKEKTSSVYIFVAELLAHHQLLSFESKSRSVCIRYPFFLFSEKK